MKYAPPTTALAPDTPDALTGVALGLMELLPSWPLALIPQHFTAPPATIAQAWESPLVIEVAPARPATATDDRLLLMSPQHFAVPSDSRAQVSSVLAAVGDRDEYAARFENAPHLSQCVVEVGHVVEHPHSDDRVETVVDVRKVVGVHYLGVHAEQLGRLDHRFGPVGGEDVGAKLPLDAPLMLEHLHSEEEYTRGRQYIQDVARSLGLSFAAEIA